MKTIIIGFSTPKKFKLLSWLICKIQKTEYSHVYLQYHSDSLDRDIIYQASGLQVNFVGKNLFDQDHVTIAEFTLEVPDDIYTRSLQTAVDKAGFPYSIKQLFSLASYLLFRKSLFEDGRSGYVCSELVGEMLQNEFGIKVSDDLDIVTPKDIFNILMGK